MQPGSVAAAHMSPRALVHAGWCLAQMGVQLEASWQTEYHATLLMVPPRLDVEGVSLAAHSVLALQGWLEEGGLEGLMWRRWWAWSHGRGLHITAAAVRGGGGAGGVQGLDAGGAG